MDAQEQQLQFLRRRAGRGRSYALSGSQTKSEKEQGNERRGLFFLFHEPLKMFSLMVCFVVGDEKSVVLSKRTEEGLLKGLREFPTVSWMDTAPSPPMLASARAELERRCFGAPLVASRYESVGKFKHVFSHIDEQVTLEMVQLPSATLVDSETISLVSQDQVSGKGVAKSTNKALQLIKKQNE